MILRTVTAPGRGRAYCAFRLPEGKSAGLEKRRSSVEALRDAIEAMRREIESA